MIKVGPLSELRKIVILYLGRISSSIFLTIVCAVFGFVLVGVVLGGGGGGGPPPASVYLEKVSTSTNIYPYPYLLDFTLMKYIL